MRALLVNQAADLITAAVEEIPPEQLPEGEVLVDIEWSCLNYKDALAITGQRHIIRHYPMVPGIDFAGRVTHSTSPAFTAGMPVVLTGWGVGEKHWGGLAQQARVKGEWLLPLPDSLTTRQAMCLGTAGLTAMLCVMALEEGGVTPEQGPILVTGATGGVGSCAIALLHALGYHVTALTGHRDNFSWLSALGAVDLLTRAEWQAENSNPPLQSQRWAGAIDCVGGDILTRILAQTRYGGTVAACGLAGSDSLPGSVLPFILRNIRLQGVDSVMAANTRRTIAWQRLSDLLPPRFYDLAIHEITLDQAVERAQALLANQISGRIVVNLRADR
ncbi:MAG: MDR family oxidoreductase [Enterobacteriaceae bacterium]